MYFLIQTFIFSQMKNLFSKSNFTTNLGPVSLF